MVGKVTFLYLCFYFCRVKIYIIHFKIISDNGFQAFVHTNQYNDCGKKVDAVLVYSNGNIGDGKYGRPVAVIKGCDIDKIKNLQIELNNLTQQYIASKDNIEMLTAVYDEDNSITKEAIRLINPNASYMERIIDDRMIGMIKDYNYM